MGLASKLKAAQAAEKAQGGYPQQGYGGAPQGGNPQQGYGQPAAQENRQIPQGGYPQQAPPQRQSYSGSAYFNLLRQTVQENQLNAFYSDQQLQQIAQTLPPKIQQVSQRWKIPMEIANDLSKLALYDIILYLDDSGSMRFDEDGERIEDLKLIVTRTAYICGLFDHNGISVRFMNNNYKGENLRDEQQVIDMINRIKFEGITPLGSNLESRVIEPFLLAPLRRQALLKPLLVITITDGEPTGESTKKVFKVVESVKKDLLNSKYRPGACAFQFAQVGNDLKAREFLGKLDTDPVVGRLVDCTSNYEFEQDEMSKQGVSLDPSTWLVKMLLGAIDPSYDTQDESRR